jgi:hypothetical protein
MSRRARNSAGARGVQAEEVPNPRATSPRSWIGLSASFLCLIFALVFSPGGTRELLRVTPAGIRDGGKWTKTDGRFRPDYSADGRAVKLDDTTFRFSGESYFVPLSPEVTIPRAFSVSFWVRIVSDQEIAPLLAVETQSRAPLFFLFSRSTGGNVGICGGVANHFGGWAPLSNRPGQVDPVDEWIHVAYVVDYEHGIQTLYVNGWKRGSESISAWLSPSLIPKRLWIGSFPNAGPPAVCEIRDVRFIEGILGWWQIQSYMLSDHYFLTLFRVPLRIVFVVFSICSILLFAWSCRVAAGKTGISPDAPSRPSVSSSPPRALSSFHHVLFLLFALAGFFLVTAAFWPGAMSPDSVEQYGQGRAWTFTDWHPPLMAAVLGIFDRLFHSPAPLLVLQAAAYWLSFYLLARAFLPISVPVAYVLGALGFWPAFITWTGVLWKDVGVNSTFLLASAVLFHHTVRGRRPSRLVTGLIAAVLLYGVLVRPYAALAYVPLAFWLAWLLCNRPSLRHRGAVLSGVFLGLMVLVPAANALTGWVLHPVRRHPIQMVMYYDLLGISAREGTTCLLHAYHTPAISCSEIKDMYTPVCADTLIFNKRAPLKELQDFGRLRNDWIRGALTHPKAYLAHRWNVFAILFSFNDRPSWNHFRAIDTNPFGFVLRSGGAGAAFDSYVTNAPSWFFFGYVYLLLSLYVGVYLVVTLWVRRSLLGLRPLEMSVLALGGSSLLYFLPYFFLAPARDFRYLYWGTVSAGLAFVVMLYLLVSAEWGGDRHAGASRKGP